jgi:hypothetical protein
MASAVAYHPVILFTVVKKFYDTGPGEKTMIFNENKSSVKVAKHPDLS